MSKSWRQTKEYRHWRVAVIRRDKRCFLCDSIQNRHAHHLNHAVSFPEQKFNVENGITLCSQCHMNYHNNYHESYRHKCTEKSFENQLNFIDLLYIPNMLRNKPYVSLFHEWRKNR